MRNASKRDLILQAAGEVFIATGFEKSTVQEIADKAGVGKGTIYEYFQSKEEVFVQVAKSNVSYVHNDLLGMFNKVETFEELLDGYIATSLSLIDKHIDKVEIIFNDLAKVSNELHEWFLEKQRQLMERLTALLQQFIENKELRDVQPEAVAWMVLHIIQLGFYYKIVYKQDNIESVLEAQKDIILNGCRGISLP